MANNMIARNSSSKGSLDYFATPLKICNHLKNFILNDIGIDENANFLDLSCGD